MIGRSSELARIDAFLASVPDGARALVLEGEPGMGKTTLWQAGVDDATGKGVRTLSARPSEAEATFAYAGLGDLLLTVDDESLARLPAPQRRALRVALLREEHEGPAADPRAVAVALLGTLREMAESGPILVAIDDTQWLDSASMIALSFALRRLGGEPIGILLARRITATTGRAPGVERLLQDLNAERVTVGPLGVAAIGDLLRSQLGLTYPRMTVERVHATSAGNPLFALELGSALGGDPLESGLDLPVPDELLSLIGGQLEQLPTATRDALAVAAVAAHPTVDLVSQALEAPAESILQPAIEAGTITISDGRIEFSHPLRAVAARSTAAASRRREVHARLARIVADPEERARHLALATTGTDKTAAIALEDAAVRAEARGAPGAAAELAAQAERLTPRDLGDDIRRRLLAESAYLMRAGDFVRAREIVNGVLAASPPSRDRAQALVLLAHVEYNLDMGVSAAILRGLLEESDIDDRVRMRAEGTLTAILDRDGRDVAEALVHGRAELETAERVGDDVHIATALRGIARNEQRRTGQMPTELIERALALEPLVEKTRPVDEWPSWCYAEMLAWTDEPRSGLALWASIKERASERGQEVTSLLRTFNVMIPYECVVGTWAQAQADADEGVSWATGLDSEYSAVAYANRALVASHLGDESAARRDAQEARQRFAPLGARKAERTTAWAVGLLELSLGEPARAHEHLGPLVEGRRKAGVREPGDMRYVTDEVEALIGMGRLDEAEALHDWFEGLAEASGRVFGLAASQRCRSLLHGARGEADEALEAFGRSRASYATIEDPFGAGRTLLALGSAQRRARQRKAARETLDQALVAFDELGAKLWSERTRTELGQIGGRASSPDSLTPSERRVAELVAEGHTNREVAAQLFVAERTVEGHLSKVYAKLGIRSRTELARKLAPAGEQEA